MLMNKKSTDEDSRVEFAAIYQSYIKDGETGAYRQAWHTVATYFVQNRGALGSCLHQMEDGRFVAYSRWPDKATRDASWPGENAPAAVLPQVVREAILIMKSCADQERNIANHVVREMCLGVVEDLLLIGRSYLPSYPPKALNSILQPGSSNTPYTNQKAAGFRHNL